MEKIYRGDGTWAEYSYDGTSARVGKRTGTVSSEETETTKYYNMGTTVLNEVSSNDGNTTNLIGAGIEARMSVTGSSITSAYFLQKNAHGDVTAAISGTERAATYDYDAFGNTLVEEGEINNPIRYSGEYLDEETGLIYLRARYYDPSVGRFISEDPARDGMNWYAYCGNSPVMMVDPLGLDHYIYYSKDQAAAAQQYANDLRKTDPNTPIHMIDVKDEDSFVNAWNQMGVVNGKEVPINKVIINIHGDENEIWGTDNKGIDLNKLDKKTMDSILLLSCNTGNIEFVGSNPASWFAVNQDAEYVVAPDGYNSRRLSNLAIQSSLISRKDDISNHSKSGRTKGKGYVFYINVNNTPYVISGISEDQEEFLSIVDLLERVEDSSSGLNLVIKFLEERMNLSNN